MSINISEGIPNDKLLDAGVHFGHLKKKWNPKMAPYIFMERKGIHIIDLNKTNEALIRAGAAMRSIARSGRKILFVATKKQAREIIVDAAKEVNMPFVSERWLGGMLTNFATIRKSIKKMQHIERLLNEESATGLTKKERLVMSREKEKLDRIIGGIADLSRLPAALFIIDISLEHIALAEARKLNLVTCAMVDTNSDPKKVDFPIPANDDASKSVAIITEYMVAAIKQGLSERTKEQIESEAQLDKQAERANDRPKGNDRDRDNKRRKPRGNNNSGGGRRRN